MKKIELKTLNKIIKELELTKKQRKYVQLVFKEEGLYWIKKLTKNGYTSENLMTINWIKLFFGIKEKNLK